MENSLKALNEKLTGELHWSAKLRALYATDGSIYRQLPLAVAIPQTQEDIGLLIIFCPDAQYWPYSKNCRHIAGRTVCW